MTNNLSTFEIILNGAPLSDTVQVQEVQVNQDLGSQDFASITVLINEQELYSKAPLSLGDSVQIMMGYDMVNSRVFNGKVIESSLQINNLSGPMYMISCESEDTNTNEDHESKITLTYGLSIFEFEAHSNAQFKLTGDVVFQGSNAINPGNYLTLNGFNDQINGDYQTTQVIQHMAEGNWMTHCHFEERN